MRLLPVTEQKDSKDTWQSGAVKIMYFKVSHFAIIFGQNCNEESILSLFIRKQMYSNVGVTNLFLRTVFHNWYFMRWDGRVRC